MRVHVSSKACPRNAAPIILALGRRRNRIAAGLAMGEIDVWRTAHVVIKQHGGGAGLFAARSEPKRSLQRAITKGVQRGLEFGERLTH